MISVKLHYRNIIKKIQIAQEEIALPKLCQTLQQFFKLEDTKLIRLVYKDDEEYSEEGMEIQTNQDLIDLLNKRNSKRLMKFQVNYSGTTQNDDDVLYTSIINQKQCTFDTNKKMKRTNNKVKNKSIKQVQHSSFVDQINQFKMNNNNSIDIGQLLQNDKKQIDLITLQKEQLCLNLLMQQQSQEQFNYIQNEQINKNHIYDQINDKIKEIFNDPAQIQYSSDEQNFQLMNRSINNELKNKIEQEVDYSNYLNQQYDIIGEKIWKIIDEQLKIQNKGVSQQLIKEFIHKLSEEIQKKSSTFISHKIFDSEQKQIQQECSPNIRSNEEVIKKQIETKIDSELILNKPNEVVQLQNEILVKECQSSNKNSQDDCIKLKKANSDLQVSMYTPNPDFESSQNQNTLRRQANDFEKILGVFEEQEQKMIYIEDVLQKTYKESEQQINNEFEKNFKNIHNLFETNQQLFNTIDKKSHNISQQRNKTISAYDLSLILDKKVQSYSQPQNLQNDQLIDLDISGQSLIESLINQQTISKSKNLNIQTKILN